MPWPRWPLAVSYTHLDVYKRQAWAARPVKERARLLKKLQGVMLDATDEITAVVNQDHGKSRLDALHEVFMTVEKIHHYTAQAPKWLPPERVPRGLYFLSLIHI